MTEQIKIAKAWGHRSSPSALLHHAGRKSDNFNVPYLIVSGISDHEAAALPEIIERERGVCEWYLSENNHGEYDYCASLCDAEYQMRQPTFCPSCGRRVKVV